MCLVAGASYKIGFWLLQLHTGNHLLTPPNTFRASVRATRQLVSKYQNVFESAYGLLPRPPQTQAAHFKRLYRK